MRQVGAAGPVAGPGFGRVEIAVGPTGRDERVGRSGRIDRRRGVGGVGRWCLVGLLVGSWLGILPGCVPGWPGGGCPTGVALAGDDLPLAPGQPAAGPGGRAYRHRDWRVTEVGVRRDRYYLFEPTRPEPVSAPVVLLLAAGFHQHPDHYRAWIEHLVGHGNVVIFPCYQGPSDREERWLDNVARSALDAFKRLRRGRHVLPQSRRLAVFGHGAGAVLAANLAVLATRYGLPSPQALLLCNPSQGLGGAAVGLPLHRHDTIPMGTVLTVAVGEDDRSSDWELARLLYYRCSSLRSIDKIFVTLRSDLRGKPALVGDHRALLSPVRREGEKDIDRRRYEYLRLHRERHSARLLRGADRDASEFYGYWKLGDALLQTAFGDGSSRLAALSEGPWVRSMGFWSDGVPVQETLSSERP